MTHETRMVPAPKATDVGVHKFAALVPEVLSAKPGCPITLVPAEGNKLASQKTAHRSRLNANIRALNRIVFELREFFCVRQNDDVSV